MIKHKTKIRRRIEMKLFNFFNSWNYNAKFFKCVTLKLYKNHLTLQFIPYIFYNKK